MPKRRPRPITPAELQARHRRVLRLARQFGFVGRIEYQHVYSTSGGAQYRPAAAPEADLVTVYAEAFERDGNPLDFSLEAIIAHERGHQLLARHPRLGPQVLGRISAAGEEILASVLGAIISPKPKDQNDLLAKATAELLNRGEQPEVATRLIRHLIDDLERLL
jgi:hypothetical protein